MKKQHKKEFVCEQDRIMAAFAKVNLREAVTPIVRGKLVEDTDTYNKVQQLLDCPEMEHAHKFLLDVDFDDLTPETKQKVDDLYQLAISQGCIKSDTDPEDEENEYETSDPGLNQPSDNSGGFENEAIPNSEEAAAKDSIGIGSPEFNSSAFVLFYSAMKNGQIKTGECYSNATTIENAKLDAVQKLKKLGFTAIDILAAEEADPSAKGCDSRQPDSFGEKTYEPIEKSDPKPVEDVKNAVPSAPAKKADNAKEDSEDEDKPEEKEDKEPEEDKTEEEKPADDKEEKEEEPEEEEPEEEPAEKEMSRSEKVEMFKEYLNEFKQLLQKMKSECYSEMSLADRAKFYDEMSKIWKDKPDPSEFMTDDNVDQIEHMKIKIVK